MTELNRKQRRLAAKKPPKANRSARSDLLTFECALAKARTDPTEAADKAQLLTSPYAQLERLTHGTLDFQGYADLTETNAAAWLLAVKLHDCAANAETQAQLAPTREPFVKAAHALHELGERRKAKGKYVARADELNTLRDALATYEQLIGVSDRAHVSHAVIEAAKHVQNRLNRRLKECHQNSD